ncbi:MAG TPA: hypothetical protein PK359_15370 [Burkholderiaceae bacterium]|jgi:hypothetical protein|nr:hypothetical protein [Burkholderiaceae bacterium]
MTTPGPDHFFSCPHCKTVLRRWTLGSGNTMGATLWSDGLLDAPMLPEPITVTRCPACRKAFFIDDAEDLGEHWTFATGRSSSGEPLPAEFQTAPHVGDAGLRALASLVAHTSNLDRLRFLCLAIWRTCNDDVRCPPRQGPAPKRAGFDSNLERLIGLLADDRGSDQLLKGEALRELGRYDQAVAALEDIDPQWAWVADQIRSMAQAGSSTVAVLRQPGNSR